MTNRTPLIAANWKMHQPPAGWDADDSPYLSRSDVDVIVFPSMLDLVSCMGEELITGAQYGRAEPSGAFTGDVSMQMLAYIGVTHVLCGHSDRRTFHGETDEDIAKQVVAALEAEMTPILCIGETAEQRKAGRTKDVVSKQLQIVLQRMQERNNEITNNEITIAYEPVWAIGTGNTATPEDAQQMHSFIRSLLETRHSKLVTRLLYGGSLNASNAADLLAQPDIDGGLIGGASLKPEEFRKIVECAQQNA